MQPSTQEEIEAFLAIDFGSTTRQATREESMQLALRAHQQTTSDTIQPLQPTEYFSTLLSEPLVASVPSPAPIFFPEVNAQVFSSITASRHYLLPQASSSPEPTPITTATIFASGPSLSLPSIKMTSTSTNSSSPNRRRRKVLERPPPPEKVETMTSEEYKRYKEAQKKKMRQKSRNLVCADCGTTSTPLWRKHGDASLCNACGLYVKQYRQRKVRKPSPELATESTSANVSNQSSMSPSIPGNANDMLSPGLVSNEKGSYMLLSPNGSNYSSGAPTPFLPLRVTSSASNSIGSYDGMPNIPYPYINQNDAGDVLVNKDVESFFPSDSAIPSPMETDSDSRLVSNLLQQLSSDTTDSRRLLDMQKRAFRQQQRKLIGYCQQFGRKNAEYLWTGILN
ncbi:UNVERIFIED_CONTAM: Transcription factor GATA-5 [Siphonaria sp. JEL0065]|nr:Transcription factor GATA-5 [Siphonaria sp. JEL0065]